MTLPAQLSLAQPIRATATKHQMKSNNADFAPVHQFRHSIYRLMDMFELQHCVLCEKIQCPVHVSPLQLFCDKAAASLGSCDQQKCSVVCSPNRRITCLVDALEAIAVLNAVDGIHDLPHCCPKYAH